MSIYFFNYQVFSFTTNSNIFKSIFLLIKPLEIKCTKILNLFQQFINIYFYFFQRSQQQYIFVSWNHAINFDIV